MEISKQGSEVIVECSLMRKDMCSFNYLNKQPSEMFLPTQKTEGWKAISRCVNGYSIFKWNSNDEMESGSSGHNGNELAERIKKINFRSLRIENI